MMASDKHRRKERKKRDRAKRAVAKEKRRQLRVAKEEADPKERFVDPEHTDVFDVSKRSGSADFASLPADATAEDREIHQWWNRFLEVDADHRLSMLRDKLNETIDDQWREALFPEAVFEAEPASNASDYVAFLESLAAEHRELYDTGMIWFLLSRIRHYLSVADHEKIALAVSQDAEVLTEIHEAYFAIMSMLRLAGLEGPADELATVGVNVMSESDLMPWAANEVFHFWMDAQVRRCVAAGGDAKAIANMERVLEERNANMDANAVLVRAEMIRRLSGRTKTKWARDQLLGTDQQARESRYLLSFEFSRWLVTEREIAPIAADELRYLVLEMLAHDELTMRSFFTGISKSALDAHVASFLNFMSLSRFKAPATLIAAEHFVVFLGDDGLLSRKALQRSLDAVRELNETLRSVLREEWPSFAFLDPLRGSS